MAKVKLQLQDKNDPRLLDFAETHVASMEGNTNYPTPVPAVVAFASILETFNQRLEESDQAQATARAATILKDEARLALEAALTERGDYVQQASAGDEVKILSSGFQVRALPAPVGELPAPVDFMPAMGSAPGEIDTSWAAVRGARSFVLEWREQGTTGPWTSMTVTRSRHTVPGLISGKTIVFRVAAVGSAGQGPWSLEAARMAP